MISVNFFVEYAKKNETGCGIIKIYPGKKYIDKRRSVYV